MPQIRRDENLSLIFSRVTQLQVVRCVGPYVNHKNVIEFILFQIEDAIVKSVRTI